MGDVCLDPEIARTLKVKDPPIYVECRNYKDVLQYNLLSWAWKGTPKVYSDWIKEVERKCDGRLPMLVIKGKGTEAWILLRKAWLTVQASGLALNPIVRIVSKDFGYLYMLPLESVRSLGNGRDFLKQWVRDGGPAQLRRLAKGSGKTDE